MKKLLFITFLLLSISSFSQNNLINTQTENLIGNVKSYEKKTIVKMKNSDEFTLKYHVKYVFDKDGNIASIESYGSDNTLDSKEVFFYTDGNLKEITQYNSVGKAGKITLFDYDEKNRINSKRKFNTQGKLQEETSYLYNSKNQLATQQKLIPSINYLMKENYTYDAKGNRVKSEKKARIGTTIEVFQYNAEHLVIKKMEYNAMGELFSEIDYKYNKQKDKIGLSKKDQSGEISYFENYHYKYDSKGNWIEKISFERDLKVSVETREIAY